MKNVILKTAFIVLVSIGFIQTTEAHGPRHFRHHFGPRYYPAPVRVYAPPAPRVYIAPPPVQVYARPVWIPGHWFINRHGRQVWVKGYYR